MGHGAEAILRQRTIIRSSSLFSACLSVLGGRNSGEFTEEDAKDTEKTEEGSACTAWFTLGL